jgi:hypothetical protein
MSPTLFALDSFQIGSHINAWAGLDHDALIYASCAAGMVGVNHKAHLLLVEMGVCPTFSQAGIEP